MKSKTARFTFNILFALMLLLGALATIVPASPVKAAELLVDPFIITENGNGTAVWTTADHYTGDWSVELTTTDPADYAGFGLTAYTDTIDNITSLSFYYKHISYSGFCGPRMALTLTRTTNHYMAMTGCAVDSAGAWKKADAIAGVAGTDWYTPGTGSQIWWYGTWDGSDPTSYVQLGGPIDFATLQGLLTTATVDTVAVYMGTVYPPNILAGSAYIDDPEINGTTYAGKIQEAIDAATAGDTINVAAGSYDESVLIDKGVILQGAPGATIAPATGPGIQIDVSPELTPVTIDGFTITPQDDTLDSAQGIVIGSVTTPVATYDVTISHNTITTQGRNMGILVRGVGTNGSGYPNCSGLTVTDNNITVSGDSTAFYASWVTPASTGWTITGNTFDSAVGVNLQLYDVEDVTIDNNTFEMVGAGVNVLISAELCNLSQPISFTNNDVLGNGAGSMVAFICNYETAGPSTMDDVTITGNTFDDWASAGRALGIYPRVTTVAINQNSFLGSDTGLRNTSGVPVDAKFNYWGDASGPSHTDATLGDITYGAAVSADVDFMPWLIAEPPASPTGEIQITTTSPLPDGNVGVAYSEPLAATGGTETYTWAFYGPGDCAECNEPPDDIDIVGSNISGTPESTNPDPLFRFGIQADDGVQGTYQPFELSIYASPLSIETTSLLAGIVGEPYSDTLEASGGIGTYTWSKYSGTLPPSLGIDAGTGEISGTPTTAGTYDFRVKVVSGTQAAYKDLSISISALEVINHAATNIASTSARLNGELISNGGGEDPDVIIYWGTTDGGTDPLSWDDAEVLPDPQALGTFYADVSGLAPDTEYFYRCYAENDLGSDWADSTESFNTLPPTETQKLIGTDTVGDGTTAANKLILGKFTAEQTGYITEIKVYSLASGNVKVAIYADNGLPSSSPSTVLRANNTPTPVTGGQWNSISLFSTLVDSGETYWLAAASDTAGALSYKIPAGTGTSKGKAITFSSFSFTDNPAGLTSYTYLRAFAGWGVISPPDLTVVTNVATDVGDGIATLNGSLTSLGTDTSADLEFQYDTDGTYISPTTVPAVPPSLSDPGTFSADLTSLTNGQEYHFRAVATGDPSTDVVYGDDMTFTPDVPLEKLIGLDTPGVNSTGGNKLILGKFTAEQTAYVKEIHVYSLASGNVKVAVYQDSGGVPSAPTILLGANNTPTPVIGGQWNTISLPLTHVDAGIDYWLAAASDVTGVLSYSPAVTPPSISKGKAITFAFFNFYSNPTGLTNYTTYDRAFSGWGTTTEPPLAVTTNAADIGDTIATLNGSLTGLGTDTSAVVQFDYGTTILYGTTVTADQSPMSAAGDFSYDLTSLTNGQEYHFRAVATGDPSTDVVYGNDMTFTPKVKLIGLDTPGGTNTGANRVILGRFQAEQTGHITEMHVYSRAAGNVKVAVYADDDGSLGSLLNANNTATPVAAGQWNTISLPSTVVMLSDYYWLAAANDVAGAISYNSTPGYISKGKAITDFSSFTFTSGITDLTDYTTYERAFSGWGDDNPPPLAVITNAATTGDETATLNGTLTSLGTDTSAVVEFEYGTDILYGTTVPAVPPSLPSPGSFSADLDSLTNGQEYHFRAVATGDPSTDIVYGDDMTFTPDVPPDKLIGSDTPGVNSTGGNKFILARFQADQTGDIIEIRVYSLASGQVKVAVYEDSGGSPSAPTIVLNVNETPTPVTGSQWNTIPIDPTEVIAGDYYWLAIANDVAGAISYGPAGSSNPSKGKAVTFSSFTFTDNPSGLTDYTYERPFAGYGDAAPPPLAVITNAATIGDETATLNGTLTSLGTDTEAVVQFEYGTTILYGTTVDADESPMSAPGDFSVDIASLTNGQEYHFRAVATGDPSTDTVYGDDMTFTPSEPPWRLIGSETPGIDSTDGNRFILGRFQAEQSGDVTEIRIYSIASGNVKVAIYEDSGGSPSSPTIVLNANETPTSVTGGQWNTITIDPTEVIAGDYYWLAVANDVAGAISYGPTGSSNPSKGKAITFSSFTFTDNPAGLTNYTYERPFAGWGQ